MSVRRGHQGRDQGQLVGSIRAQVPEEAEHLARTIAGVGHQAAHHLSQGMEAEPERGHHAEVAAATPQSPHQVLVGLDHAPVRGHHLGPDQVVAGDPVLADQPADAPAQGEAGHAGARDQAAGGREAVRLRRLVEVEPGRAGLGGGGCAARFHPDRAKG
jgi:hypothetical protein